VCKRTDPADAALFMDSSTLLVAKILHVQSICAQTRHISFRKPCIYPTLFTAAVSFSKIVFLSLITWGRQSEQSFGTRKVGDTAQLAKRSKRGLRLTKICFSMVSLLPRFPYLENFADPPAGAGRGIGPTGPCRIPQLNVRLHFSRDCTWLDAL